MWASILLKQFSLPFSHHIITEIQNDQELRMHGNKFSAPRNLASSFKETPTRLLMSGNDKRLSTTGFLHKKSNKTGKWSKVWCGLGDNILYTFKAQDDPKAATSTPILGYELILNTEVSEPTRRLSNLVIGQKPKEKFAALASLTVTEILAKIQLEALPAY